MDISVWLPPAAIIAVIIFTQSLMSARIGDINKRIDDLRSQMSREHDALAKKVDKTNELLIAHITDHKLHNV